MSLYAGLQASLHNGPMTRKDGQMFHAAMFMPGYREEPAREAWRSEKAKFNLLSKKALTAEERKANKEMRECFADRSRRMDDARARGASSKELQSIMEES
jgi:hypothetical protein